MNVLSRYIKFIKYHCLFNNTPRFCTNVEIDGNLASLACLTVISTDDCVFKASEWSVMQCLHPDFEASGLVPIGTNLLGMLASKLKTF